MELNFDEFKPGGLAWEARSSNMELENHFSTCLKTDGNQDVEMSGRKTFWMHTDCLEREIHLYGT
jgi:hypothetical protein